MRRVRVNPYGPSNSAKELAGYLGVKRLLANGRFVGRHSDVVINWGKGRGRVGNARQINKLERVQLASNKLSTLRQLRAFEISIPYFTHTSNDIINGKTYLARKTLYGHSGEGIEVFTASSDELYPSADMYVEYIEKKYEYRAIVVGDEVVDYKQKKKKASPRDEEGNIIEGTRIEHDTHVWNLSRGYIMARENVRKPEGVDDLAISAVKALGLDFGAVDIIEDEEGKLYVLEVNTAFGLEGSTIQKVGDAIKRLIL